MRLKYIIYPLAIIALLAMLNGCEKFTEGLNTSSTVGLDASAGQLFSGAQLGYMQVTEGGLARLSAMLTQQANGEQNQYAAYETYTITSQDFINEWATAYAQCFADIKLAETKAAASPNLRGAIEVLEGLHMGTITALWGAVPYSQAGQAPVILQPAYDAQATVYAAVQTVLSQAITDLTTSDGTLTSKVDIFSSGGSVPKWRALAYSAKARYFMHVARSAGYTSASMDNVINNALLGIKSTDGSQDVSLTHGTVQGGNQNLWYSFMMNDRAGYIDAATTFAEPMLHYRNVDGKSDDAARHAFYYFWVATSPTSGYWDLNYYETGAAFDIDQTSPVFHASETLLLLAEAYYRKADYTNALTYLNSARTYANNVFGSNLSAYVAGDFSTNPKLLQAILNEQYLALAFQIEAFNFARRVNFAFTYTDSSAVVHTIAPTFGTQFPQRFLYSQDELTAYPNAPVTTLFQKTDVNNNSN